MPLSSEIFPDGKNIAFSWGGDLWKVSSAGGEATRLTQHPATDIRPHFSPDGQNLYFNSNRNGNYQIFKKQLSTGEIELLTPFTEDTHVDDISDDGQTLLVTARRDYHGRNSTRLFEIDINNPSSESSIFNTFARNGQLSPDKNKIIFTREGVESYRKQYQGTQASQVWIYDKQSEKFSQPVKSDKGVRWPIWQPDGKGFYYVGQQDGTFNLYNHHLESNNSKQITFFKDDGVIAPTLSKDGKSLVFQNLFNLYHLSTEEGAKPKKLEIFHLQEDLNQPIKKVTISKTTDISFSESGLEIALAANNDIYVMDTVLKEPVAVTSSPEHESNIVFGKDNKEIFYIKDNGHQSSLCKVTRADDSKFWWESTEFNHQTIFEGSSSISNFSLSPNTEKLVISTTDGLISFITVDGEAAGEIDFCKKSCYPTWSPNSKWITFTSYNDSYNYEIYLAKADASEAPINLSQHPDNDSQSVWSPDGKKIAFLGKRHGSDYDIYIADLYQEEQSSRAEKIEKARKAMDKDSSYSTKESNDDKTEKDEEEHEKKDDKTKQENQKKENTPAEEKQKDEEKSSVEENKTEQEPKEEKPFFLKGLAKRFKHIKAEKPIHQLRWSANSASLFLKYRSDKGIYKVDLKTGKTNKYSDASGHIIRVDKGDKIFMLNNYTPSLVTGGKAKDYTFKIYAEIEREVYFKNTFNFVWRTLHNEFYDTRMNNKDWSAIREKYADVATKSVHSSTFSRIIYRMLGELNASHTGYSPVPWSPPPPLKKVTHKVVHLGVRFDTTHQGRGYKINEILPHGPATKEYSQLENGELIVEIDGKAIQPSTPLSDVLNKQIGAEITLKVENLEGESRDVTILPISYANARELSLAAHLEKNEALVDKLSDQKLGYIHIAKMAWQDFEQFERHIHEKGYGKDGLVIDVRENSGGFTADHLLTVLTYQPHASTAYRNGQTGYPQDRIVYSTWTKPIIVLCNQNSFSNAEIFSHAIKNLKRGKVVGVPTAGGVISTMSRKLPNMGSLRLPIRGWFTPDGTDMEMHGAQPDILIWPTPEELTKGIDKQLETATKELLKDVKQYRPPFKKPIYKSQR